MIQSLSIKNFQSHKDTSLDFHPGVNVIVGSSDSGKTSVIRALRWLIWNRPNGDDFRSDWGGETSVEVIVDDKSIRRSKDKENLYEIGAVNSQDYKKLKAFGTKIPEQIQGLLNIDDTNLQKQFDSPFLISASPGEVAAYFNQIAHLETIDSSISYVNGKVLNLNASHKADTATLEESQEELKQYDYLQKFEIDLEELEHQASAHIQKISSQKRLRAHLELMESNNVSIQKQEQVLALEKPVDQLLIAYEERDAKKEEKLTLGVILVAIVKMKEDEAVLLKKVKLLPQVKALLKLHQDRKTEWQNMLALKQHLREIRNTKQKQEEWETTVENKENTFHENMPDICPLCGKETT